VWQAGPFPASTDGGRDYGTFTFTLSSAVMISNTLGPLGIDYRVKASGHVVCVNPEIDPISGLSETPGTVTIDLTMN
jgi:hypothetical protein